MMMIRVLVMLMLLAGGTARAEPSDRTLVYTGLALIPPTYLLGVALHEGSHALGAKLVGAKVVEMHLFPPGRDPKGHWRFGWTYVRGLKTKPEKLLFYLAPKITDAVLLGGVAALVFTSAWPENRYGQLGLTVFAIGLWVDFSKDVLAFRKTNDVVKAFDLWCIRGWRQVPARLLYTGLIVGAGLVAVRGLQRTFEDDGAPSPRVLPLIVRGF
jgi:hypothetical protein